MMNVATSLIEKSAMPVPEMGSELLSSEQITSRAFATFLNRADPLNDLSPEDRNSVLGKIKRINLDNVLMEIDRLEQLTEGRLWKELAGMFPVMLDGIKHMREQRVILGKGP